MEKQLRIQKARHHILDGLLVAIRNHEEVQQIQIDKNTAQQKLIDRFAFSIIQAQAIMDLRKPLVDIDPAEIIVEQEQILGEIHRLEQELSV